MRLLKKEKIQLLDFIIGMECFDKNFILSLKKSFKNADTIDFYTIYNDFYKEIETYYLEMKDVFSTPYYPMLQMLYRKLYSTKEITTVEQFLTEIKLLSEQEIHELIYAVLKVEPDTKTSMYDVIDSLNYSGEVRYYLTKIYACPLKFIENVEYVFENIYPIFLEHYARAEKLFSDKLARFSKLPALQIYKQTSNFMGSEKLSKLNNDYLQITDDVEKHITTMEIVPLLFGANRIVHIEKQEQVSRVTPRKYKDAIYCVGINLLNYSEKIATAEEISKKVLKALSDDTRFDILRMISYGFDTNKKLSKLFKVSPPAITYQTNILKEANLITVDKSGVLTVKKGQLEVAFKKIELLLSMQGDV